MTTISPIEVQALAEQLKKEPTNLDLMNTLALSYLNNPAMQINEDKVLKLLNLAYQTQKTVKSTHNLAWYLYFEIGEDEKALNIQQECIKLQPKSYYPYYQYGYMLLQEKKFDQALIFLNQAHELEKHRAISHNIGYCYFKMKDFEKAKDFFTQAATDLDTENKSLYNLALCEWQLNNSKQLKVIADKLSSMETKYEASINGYYIGFLYFLLNDFQKASECLIKQGINRIELISWTDLSYSVFKTNKELWQQEIKNYIAERKQWQQEIENHHQDWKEYTGEARNKQLNELKSSIKLAEKYLNHGVKKPRIDLNTKVLAESYGCLLFGCKTHNKKENDEA